MDMLRIAYRTRWLIALAFLLLAACGAPQGVTMTTTTPVSDAIASLGWTRRPFGTAWNIEYPAGWTGNEAGVAEGFVSVEGMFDGRSYAVQFVYPIIGQLDMLTLESWVDREVRGLFTPEELLNSIHDLTIAGTPAKKVLGVRPDPSQPVQHRVYIWKHGTTNPRLVTIQPTDGGLATETMEALLDRFIAGIAAVAGETTTAVSGTTTGEENAGTVLAAIRRQVKHPVWVPAEVPAGLAPADPALVQNGGAEPPVAIEYRADNGATALTVLNGWAGCCLDADPRKRQGAVQISSGATAYYLDVEAQ